ncbi:MAG: glycoside hydrolase family 97 N-terminal domain-containing protein [Paludibacter sp.]|nr:glycoside hydrolase family 97 N-terminal domain-containing protein [Paludibacter sp.]
MRLIFLYLVFFAYSGVLLSQTLQSPDGNIQIEFSLSKKTAHNYLEGTPMYAVSYKGLPFLLPSRLGFELLGTAEMKSFLKVKDVLRKDKRSSWKPVYGECSEYPDNYNEMTVVVEESLPPHRELNIVFRAYNEGIAFRYEIPAQKGFEKIVIHKELTEFVFPQYTSVWQSYGHEGKYSKVYVNEIQPNCELPLTCMTESGIYGAIFEAANNNYPRAYVHSPNKRGTSLGISIRGEAKSYNGIITAWRAITLASQPGSLIENNYLILNLNDSCRLAETSWIKPGTVMREIDQNTAASFKLIDFCARKGIDYILYDALWYGPDKDIMSYPGTPKPELDIHATIKYAKDKGIGVFVYLDKIAVERYADVLFPLYEKWGVKGIKPGFVSVGNQEWQEWIEDMVKIAAKHHLMVNIHDAYRPTGFSRTYPNLITQEGIHGNEQQPNADHDVMLPFTRFTIGAGDYTPGYLREGLQSTFTHRLALPIIFYSPAQFLFWRERPEARHDRPELKLWEHIPTVWDYTKVIDGAIGEHVIIARRNGSTWYVGGITNTNARTMILDCSFLNRGKQYKATIYTDNLLSEDKVDIETRKVSSKDKITFNLKKSGGFALKIE